MTGVDELMSAPTFGLAPEDKRARLLEVLRAQVLEAAELNPDYGRFVRSWPIRPKDASAIHELPCLPVASFKREPPLSLVAAGTETRVVTSSATTGQAPSRIAIDAATSRRMTRGAAAVLKDFIGAGRRPLLVIDTPEQVAGSTSLSARGAAIRAVLPFATSTTTCLIGDELGLDRDALDAFATEHRGEPVLLYGFTWILWTRLIRPLADAGESLGLGGAHILHSGGWKRLQQDRVDRSTFDAAAARAIGCPPEKVVDFYGMVEHVGVVYPDCSEGSKHAPSFAEVIVRDPLTFAPVDEGGAGLIQVCSVLPSSFPGHLLLTEDMAQVVSYDGCPCGRRGIAFRFTSRVPKAELRGCSDVAARRLER